jgi:copper(I)-binding protein
MPRLRFLRAAGSTLVVLAWLLAGVRSGAASSPLVASDAWVRAAASTQMNTAAYMVLQNTTAADVSIVAVTSPAAGVAELHEMREDNGVMRMRKVERLTVPARGTVALKPGGLHVMLFRLTAPLQPGAKVAIGLTTADGSMLTVTADVRPLE